MMGTLEALYCRMSGGVVPSGSWRSCVCAMAVTCATALAMLTLGWKKILTTAMPFSDCDSMCSMLLTVVVSDRSESTTIRLAICSGERPVYCQTIATTGMLMLGKMSVGVVSATSGPRISRTSARTAKVYGRRSARRTIHIV